MHQINKLELSACIYYNHLQMKAQGEDKQSKEQSTNTAIQKISRKLYFIFCGEEQVNTVINRSLISNTYQQIIEIVNIAIIYGELGHTNNSTYDIIQAVFSAVLVVLCIIPRLSYKYYIFLLIIIAFVTVIIASLACIAVLIINYLTFRNYCSILRSYSLSQPSFSFRADGLCTSISNLYTILLVSTGCINLVRTGYIYLAMQAYRVSKKIFNEEQKRRRRKQRFDQNLKSKNPYSVNRKI